jgi:hypothetical protein
LKNNATFEKNSIETMIFFNEENFLEIKKFKSEDSSSFANEEEDCCCYNPHESSEVVVNIPLVSPTIHTIQERSINKVENFNLKDLVSTIDVEQNYCLLKPKFSNEILKNQHMESKSTHTNSQVDMDSIQSLIISKNPLSSKAMTSKSDKIFLDEYGQIMKNGSDSSHDEDGHDLIDLKKNIKKDSLKIDEQNFINQNHEMQSTNLSLSPLSHDEKKQRHLQRCGTKWNMSPSKNVDYKKNTFKNYGHELYPNVNDGDNDKKKRFGKCKFYARGHCRRGHHCWFEHSTTKIDEKYDKKYNKDLNKNNNKFKRKSWQAISREYSNGNMSSSSSTKKQNESSEHIISLD